MMHLKKQIFLTILFLSLFATNLFAEKDIIVKKIKIEGSKNFSKKELRNQLSIKASSWTSRNIQKKSPAIFDDEILKMGSNELKHFYYSEGFIHVDICSTVEFVNKKKSRVKIIYTIKENSPTRINKINLICNNSEICAQIEPLFNKRKFIFSNEGSIFRDENIKTDQNNLNQFLVEKGYAFVQVNPIIRADSSVNSASVSWNINAGPLNYLGEVAIVGNNRTPDDVILKQLTFKKGDVYNRAKLNKSQLQVFQLGTFHIASIQAKLSDTKSDTIPIEIITKEAPKHSAKFGIGYGREDRIRTFIDYRILNFTGGARRLHLYAKHSNIEPYRFEATFTQPAFLSPNSTISLSPGVGKINEVSYKLFGYGANINFQQKITNNISASITPYYEYVKIDTTSHIIESDFELLKSAYSKNGITIGAIFDNSNPKTDPKSGWSLAFNNKISSNLFNANYPFIKIQTEVKKFIPVGNSITLAFKAKGGTINPIKNNNIPIEERFFAGGSRSIRGWQRYMLGPSNNEVPTGGKSNFEITFEPRIDIYGPLGMVVFIDAGDVWTESYYFKINDLKYAAGGGLRFKTPIGPIGIDIATPFFEQNRKLQFHINIGHAF